MLADEYILIILSLSAAVPPVASIPAGDKIMNWAFTAAKVDGDNTVNGENNFIGPAIGSEMNRLLRRTLVRSDILLNFTEA